MANPRLNSAIRIIALVVLLGAVVYLYVLSTSEDVVELKQKLFRLSKTDFVVPILLSLGSYFLRFLRWRLILKNLGHSLSLKIDFICYLAGFALTMTPGKSGETIRSAFLLQSHVPLSTSLSAFVIERSFDLLIVGLLATLLFVQPLITLILLFVALVTISVISAWFANKKSRSIEVILPKFFLPFLGVLSHASKALKPKYTLLYVLLGMAAWVTQGMSFYAIVCLFTLEINAFEAVSTYCAGLFIGAVSLVPGGIGVTEGSLSWLLQMQGVDQNSAILSALISRVCTLWLAVAVGCCALAAIIKGQAIPKVATE